MSIKTIAINVDVYERLAGRKNQSESFTKVIDRLLTAQESAGTCEEAVEMAARTWAQPRSDQEVDRDADLMESLLTERRGSTDWEAKEPG
jgi:predicted CopG family antitoxin